jgi:hypothetical protein
METSILSEHLMISLLPWMVGVLLGGGLGYSETPLCLVPVGWRDQSENTSARCNNLTGTAARRVYHR